MSLSYIRTTALSISIVGNLLPLKRYAYPVSDNEHETVGSDGKSDSFAPDAAGSTQCCLNVKVDSVGTKKPMPLTSKSVVDPSLVPRFADVTSSESSSTVVIPGQLHYPIQ